MKKSIWDFRPFVTTNESTHKVDVMEVLLNIKSHLQENGLETHYAVAAFLLLRRDM